MGTKEILMKIKFAKCDENAIIPTKRAADAGFDIYILPPKDEVAYIIQPGETKLLPTGLKSIIESGYYVQIQERGSTGSKGIKYGAGVIDSNYRGEWFLACTNCSNKPLILTYLNSIRQEVLDSLVKDNILYNIDKAIFQGIVHQVPECVIEEVTEEEIAADTTDRGDGKLGSSGK
jgi:dUTP pyrophosphatase